MPLGSHDKIIQFISIIFKTSEQTSTGVMDILHNSAKLDSLLWSTTTRLLSHEISAVLTLFFLCIRVSDRNGLTQVHFFFFECILFTSYFLSRFLKVRSQRVG